MKIHNLSDLPTIDYRTVKPLQGNLKDLDQKNHDRLLRVLNKRGFTTPIFIWKNPEDSELYLLDGHQRQRVMQKNDLNDNGNYLVPYALIPGATEHEAKEQLLEITSQYGHMTMEGLDEFAFDLDLTELDVHFDALDLDKFLDGLHDKDEIEEDEAPEVDEQNPPESKLGEIYQLGRHRLMCGDSTDFGTVSELMNGVQADMVFTDPPYGVDYEGINNDDRAGLRNLLTETFTNISAVTKPGSAFYCFHSDKCADIFNEVYRQFCHFSSMLIWVKPALVLSQSDYHSKHEPMLYGWLEGAPHKWYGDRQQTTVWEFGKESHDGHTTPKPTALIANALKQSSTRSDVILDLFGGSGSTLIAADKLDRTCYMMELDPKYCDVIRKRYANHIGAEDWQAATPVVQAVEV